MEFSPKGEPKWIYTREKALEVSSFSLVSIDGDIPKIPFGVQ